MSEHTFQTNITFRWAAMMARCYDPENASYPNYGGRGIKVCERWHDFRNFCVDVGSIIPDGLSLDRVDNDGDYSPENVQLVDARTQANNTRRNRKFTYKGRTLTISAWAREAGIDHRTLRVRLDLGWSIERAIEEPIREWAGEIKRLSEQSGVARSTIHYRLKRGEPPENVIAPVIRARTFECEGKSLTLREWANLTGVQEKTLAGRIERGWPIHIALTTPRKHSLVSAKFVQPDGQVQTLREAAKEKGIDRKTLAMRLKRGMTPADAISLPPRKWTRVEYLGRTNTLSGWAKEFGINPSTLLLRINLGWDIARAIETPVDSRRGKKPKHPEPPP